MHEPCNSQQVFVDTRVTSECVERLRCAVNRVMGTHSGSRGSRRTMVRWAHPVEPPLGVQDRGERQVVEAFVGSTRVRWMHKEPLRARCRL